MGITACFLDWFQSLTINLRIQKYIYGDPFFSNCLSEHVVEIRKRITVTS